MSEISVVEGHTKEPTQTHFDSEQKLHESQGYSGKSLAAVLSDRPEGLHNSAPLVDKLVIQNGEEMTTHSVIDFIPPTYRDAFDEDGYLNDPQDPFWQRTSCFQTAALVGIYGTSPEEIQAYDEQGKGSVKLIMDKTDSVDSSDPKYRDIIFLKSRGQSLVHSCNYVARTKEGETIVLSKDGKGPTVPVRLRKLNDVVNEYQQHNPDIQLEYRREVR